MRQMRRPIRLCSRQMSRWMITTKSRRAPPVCWHMAKERFAGWCIFGSTLQLQLSVKVECPKKRQKLRYVLYVNTCLFLQSQLLALSLRPFIMQHFLSFKDGPFLPTAAARTAAAVVCSRNPDRTAVSKKMTPLESSHGHHLQALAASACAARGRCFDPKRAATAPGRRVCSASREHRVGSLLIVLIGQDQTQAHSSSSTRSSSTTPDDGSHPPHRPPSMPY